MTNIKEDLKTCLSELESIIYPLRGEALGIVSMIKQEPNNHFVGHLNATQSRIDKLANKLEKGCNQLNKVLEKVK